MTSVNTLIDMQKQSCHIEFRQHKQSPADMQCPKCYFEGC